MDMRFRPRRSGGASRSIGVGTTALYYARFNGTNGWHGDSKLPNHHSKEGPALAVYNDHLYCVHRGGASGGSLWWTRFNGSTWHPDTQLTDHFSAQGPTIVNYRDRNGTENQLFCVHRGN
ncbi:hypothetical protein OG840_22500 [Streptomyces sp. NBC_01764]|uniref:hypothetical protein n=1 Tax=Streptomyces sp. NBC_01764 TaxID=2975935 RepID=UPI00225A4569|nr:hypothetical protein [Streptomyces sp. NBC_01764]MCX4404386.1 hypothetical protein [Streptomyces sp. NBC_01764]